MSKSDCHTSSRMRYGDYLHGMEGACEFIRYGDLVEASHAASRRRIKVRPRDTYRILQPYVSVRFSEQFKSVAPLGIYLALFQLLILRQTVSHAVSITAGLLCVVIGLMVFMEGLKLGLMPFSEMIGSGLPRKTRLGTVLMVAFGLGLTATFAEPAVGVLQVAGSSVSGQRAPLLKAMLEQFSTPLVLAIGAGVGAATVLGVLRFIFRWSLKPLIYASVLPVLALTIYAHVEPSGSLRHVIGLAWDCGGVTTGPVTVPLVLALGIGVAGARGNDESGLQGFGIVTLASLLPVLGVLALGVGVHLTHGDDALRASLTSSISASTAQWYDSPAINSLILAARAVVPLTLILLIILSLFLRERLANPGIIAYGLGLCLVGMAVFNIGLSYGLGALGEQVGALVPSAFRRVEGVSESPLYASSLGVGVAVLFSFLLGFGATLAEPALRALSNTVDDLTSGAVEKRTLLYAVSLGVGIGVALGVSKVIWDFSLAWVLVPGYATLLVLTFFSSEKMVNIAWDAAGVTTGPVTVPLVIAIGLGLGNACNVIEGFGILSTASLCPILTVLIVGLAADRKTRKSLMIEDSAADAVNSRTPHEMART